MLSLDPTETGFYVLLALTGGLLTVVALLLYYLPVFRVQTQPNVLFMSVTPQEEFTPRSGAEGITETPMVLPAGDGAGGDTGHRRGSNGKRESLATMAVPAIILGIVGGLVAGVSAGVLG